MVAGVRKDGRGTSVGDRGPCLAVGGRRMGRVGEGR